MLNIKTVPLSSLTLRLVTTRGSTARWKLALRYALPTGRSKWHVSARRGPQWVND